MQEIEEIVTLEDLVNKVDYGSLINYIPSQFSLEFVNFIKLVNGSNGSENKTPIFHYVMLDQLIAHRDNLFVVFRGGAKTSILAEIFILYLAVYGKIPNFGSVNVGMYVSDTMDNGVKNLRNNLEFRYNNSEFLQKYVPSAKFTDVEWEFKNIDGKLLTFRGFGANTGVRGFKKYGERPTICIYDDLMSDKNASSPTIINDIENIVYKAARQAMHPTKRMSIWTGTPFNKKDPLYKAASSKAWNTKVFPVCQKFPCIKKDFIGAWEDRFNYESVKTEYSKLFAIGKIDAFNQELMLRILSDEDRLVQDKEILYYDLEDVLNHMEKYNFYITTDFATSEKQSSDPSAISVWAYSQNYEWLWVDGILKQQDMGKNIDDLFSFVEKYKPVFTGIETSGQQGGFIAWIKREMTYRKIWFALARDKERGNEEGFRSTISKLNRFNLALPLFRTGRIKFPKNMKDSYIIQEGIQQIRSITYSGIKSLHDDFVDSISQLPLMYPIAITEHEIKVKKEKNSNNIFTNNYKDLDDDDENSNFDSYII